MKITALVENQSHCNLKPVHGLSFYIETEKHKLLFDLGPDDTLFSNAEKKGIDLKAVDTVILSHGHTDHGGALELFLQKNTTAKIYAQRKAFEPHSVKVLCLHVNVGLKEELKNHRQMILLDGDFVIDEELRLFTVPFRENCDFAVNDRLYEGEHKDAFLHEQSLLISEKKQALIMGCGHAGIVNILKKAAPYRPVYCIGGYHLSNPVKRRAPSELLERIAEDLQTYRGMRFYTCHCTGRKAYRYLRGKVEHMNYFSCGESLVIG